MIKLSHTIVQSNAEIETVASLAKTIWTQHYTPIIGTEQVSYMLDKYQNKRAISKQLADGYEYTLWNTNRPSGYLSLKSENDALFISKIYVLVEDRGLGHGKLMMNYATQKAKENKLNQLRLTVNKYNSKTIAAYERMGFVKLREVVFDIGNGYVMDDYEMVMSV